MERGLRSLQSVRTFINVLCHWEIGFSLGASGSAESGELTVPHLGFISFFVTTARLPVAVYQAWYQARYIAYQVWR
jgi:uncharacterized membrane protein YwaF